MGLSAKELAFLNGFVKETINIFNPPTLKEFVGQESSKHLLDIIIRAAQKENRSLPNLLFTGPAGVGKTTLATLVVKEFSRGNKISLIDGQSINKSIPTNGLIIVDEIHNVDSPICDALNLFMDAGTLQIIGATTDPGMLPAPFRSRFRMFNLVEYTQEEIARILAAAIKRKGVTSTKEALDTVTRRSRSNPRTGLQYLAMIFDFMAVQNRKSFDTQLTQEVFNLLRVDYNGFTELDRRYLAAIPKDRAVGLGYISAVMGTDETTILQDVEPYLLQKGLIDRTKHGRVKIKEVE